MAIIENEEQSNFNNDPSGSAKAAGSKQPEGQRQHFWSFHQQNVVNSPVAAGVGGEYYTKMRAKLSEIYKDIAEGVDVTILALNRQNFPALKFSALVIACRMPNLSESVVAFHTLVLEATGDRLGSVMKQIDNMPVSINRVTSDAWDAILYKTAFDAVTTQFPNCQIFSADAMVIPGHVSSEKNPETVENIARNAALACVSVINAATDDFGQLNLAYMDRECRFVIDVAFGNHQVYDVTGAPQRSSVLINYSSQKKTNQSIAGLETVNVADNVARICELSGFVQPIWAPLDPQTGFGFQQYPQTGIPPATQKYAAEFVITSVQTPFATSPAAVLLALSSSLALVDNDAWIQAFLPKSNLGGRGQDNKVDITDIGALNIAANLAGETNKGNFGTAVDVAGMKGDLMEINKYLVSLFRRGLAISMDCPEAGAQSWYLSVFAEAAQGNQAAYNQIYAAAQELTNNQFGNFFKQGEPMFTNIVRVPLGHYVVGDQVQDIRNIDLTAIANLFAGNPAMIHEYSGTFVERPGVSAARNLAIREGIIRDALNQQVTIDGYAARVTWSDKLILALSSAIAECGLPVTVNTPLNADMLRTGQPSPTFINQSLAANTRTFSAGYSQAARPQGQYRFGGNRFNM